jgi:hypothetical protein
MSHGAARKRPAAASKNAPTRAVDVRSEVRSRARGGGLHLVAHRLLHAIDLGRRRAHDLDLRVRRAHEVDQLRRRDAHAARRVGQTEQRPLDRLAQAPGDHVRELGPRSERMTEHRAVGVQPHDHLGIRAAGLPVDHAWKRERAAHPLAPAPAHLRSRHGVASSMPHSFTLTP